MLEQIENLYKLFLQNQTISTDSRNLIPDSIFFSLKGENFNGNEFAVKALDAGCSLAVIDDEKFKKDNRYFLVDNVLSTLQQLANYHRKQLNIPIIAITGTNGKTTSKELLHAVLSQKFKTLSTKGNLNNHIGVPLTLLSINKSHEIAIIEMGANHQNEIEVLCRIAEPNFGMITNIGKAHLEGFGGYEGVVKTKNELYQFIKEKNGFLFVNEDNQLLKKLSEGIKKIIFGTNETYDTIGLFIESNPFVKLKIKQKNEIVSFADKKTINTKLVGKYNFENILAAACIGNYFGVSENEIRQGLENYVPSLNRSQAVQTKNNFLLLDAYNANPSSMKVAIENFAEMDAKNKILILGDMLELGTDTEKEHNSIIHLIQSNKFDKIFFVGKYFSTASKKTSAKSFKNTEEAKQWFNNNLIENSTILIKGSRGMQLEKLVEFF
ncbi:MAG TPA: UDP-N-acetylmuramoyl-tripeptide--D-alanyl-D-alanine ligase [Bacteroidia bacterium]|nr:UDP-N-acetylmuramoyl-tripeptide--D-alanyl-D-alanine ligase [Bacteroidia bacterium]